jgi:F420-non-reducing hydrogenase small subunit
MENKKLNIAIYWAGACGGCDVSVLDTDLKVLEIAAKADIRFWPIALDFKVSDVEALGDGILDAVLFNGMIRNSEQLHMAKLLRQKTKIMIAYGTCACMGGVPGLANFFSRDEILDKVYKTCGSMEVGAAVMPLTSCSVAEGTLKMPEFYGKVQALHQEVEVDYFLPGCPPTTNIINTAFDALLSGKLPAKGSVIAGSKNLCEECPRIRTGEKNVKKFIRVYEAVVDEEKCLLEQGVLCAGPATRSGCGAACISVNMPCRGCFGPADGVYDMGAKILSAAASVINSSDEDEINAITDTLADPAGIFYRFSLPVSLLKGGRK